ncbi:MAG: UDP-N-acetylmuramoyl-tripeptide--D-alanyl-D-alanine ligase [Candidatus Sedimenticola sp. (ex Thyasira tokunagai)]
MPKKLIRALKHKLREYRAIRRRKSLGSVPCIAITGSCGKTSTTRFLGHIISQHGQCHIGINENGRLAIVKTLVRATSDLNFIVQEVSGDKPGTLRRVLPILLPNIGIVTTVGRDHHTNFRSLENTAQEKGTLPEMLPKDGVAILNADDPNVLSMTDRTMANVITYGNNPLSDVSASDVCFSWPEGLAFTVNYQGESVRVETKLFGDIWVSSLLAAIAGALSVGIDLKSCATSLSSVKPYNRRMSAHRTPFGVWFINDCFKSPHWSVPGAIQSLKGLTAPRKTLVLGSFSDSSGGASKKYRSLAKKAVAIADRTVFVGKNAQYVTKMITPELEGRLFVFESVERVNQWLLDSAAKGEIILIKSIRMEHLERLIHGQTHQLQCWKQQCNYTWDCATCEISGMSVDDENQLVQLPEC